ncbi:hypothetical protein DL95DRAFT_467002 [Leptodontidium sp. 2 PMI_412]|nr:hypothetical protein DL95DRAFT_467002 [Leptodontidium sp. 2 PMI_412]
MPIETSDLTASASSQIICILSSTPTDAFSSSVTTANTSSARAAVTPSARPTQKLHRSIHGLFSASKYSTLKYLFENASCLTSGDFKSLKANPSTISRFHTRPNWNVYNGKSTYEAEQTDNQTAPPPTFHTYTSATALLALLAQYRSTIEDLKISWRRSAMRCLLSTQRTRPIIDMLIRHPGGDNIRSQNPSRKQWDRSKIWIPEDLHKMCDKLKT